jgi:hypothetical protein
MPLPSWFQKQWKLNGNPFPDKGTYSEDGPTVYVPEMFGKRHREFLTKFILAPLENGQPLMGAVWSVEPGDPKARGFGKSTLMAEEAKKINIDFGLATLMDLGVSEKDAREYPILTSYVSFNVKSNDGIANIDAAGFHLVRFLLRHGDTHRRLRERAAAILVKDEKAVKGQESEAIVGAVLDRFRQLAVTIDVRNLLEDFLFHLADPNSEKLDKFLSTTVSSWHHNRNGLKYLQIFVVFAELAGIHHFTFFVDQVEDFTSEAAPRKIQKNVKIIRDALLESEPFASRASFVFQFHPEAYHKLRDAWAHEDLRDLNYDSPLNTPFVVVLKGLENFDAARLLVEKYLNDPRYALEGRKPGIWPFTPSSLKKIWEANRRPRWLLRVAHNLLQLAKNEKVEILDDKFVAPKLAAQSNDARREEEDQTDGVDERLA